MIISEAAGAAGTSGIGLAAFPRGRERIAEAREKS